jgi:branched-chain amino acid transport system permease protein
MNLEKKDNRSMDNAKYVMPIKVALFVIIVTGMPLVIKNPYLISIGTLIGIYSLFSLGLSLLMGYAGQVSLGQAAFYGIGAYVSALLSIRWGVNPWVAMILGALLSALVAGLLGMVVLKLEGHLLAVATLAFCIVIHTIFERWTSVTGGIDGIPGIPGLSIAGLPLRLDVHYYYLVWAFLLVILAFTFNVVNSRIGRALRSIHHFLGGSEMAAESLGISPMKYKIKVFMLSAVYASLAGSLYVHWLSLVTPSTFGLLVNIYPLIIITIGGIGSLWGAIIGAAVFFIAAEGFRALIPLFMPSSTGEYEIVAWGIMIILVLQFLPRGLVSIPDLLGLRGREKNAQSSYGR